MLNAPDVTTGQAIDDGALRYALDHGMEGVAVLDEAGLYTYMNPAHAAMYGFAPEELQGKSWRELYEPHVIATIEREYFPRLLARGSWCGELVGRKKSGDRFDAEVSLTLLPREGGRPRGMICTCRDISDVKRAAKALKVSEERYELAVTAAQLGVFEHDHEVESLYWSPILRHIYKVGADDSASMQRYIDMIHPDDRARVMTAIQRAHDSAGEGRYVVEHRIVRPDGTIRWLNIRSQTCFCGTGAARRPVRTVGMIADITERKQTEAFQAMEKRTLEMISKGLPLPKVLEDICLAVEEQAPPVICSILLTTPDGAALTLGAAPNLPNAYNRALEGIGIGPTAGSCGRAAALKTVSIAADISSDPLWESFQELALSHGLRACWSSPLLTPTGDLLGTLALYHRQPQTPQDEDFRLIARASRLTELVIVKWQLLDRLRISQARPESANSSMAGLGMDEWGASQNTVADGCRSRAQDGVVSLSVLTPRQRKILQLIAEGRSSKAMATKLSLSVKTIETHRAALMKRLKIHDVPGLVRLAIRLGLVTADH